MTEPRIHGGPDARGPAPHDFSTNANACGPCPMAAAALASADTTHYPDPNYTALRAALARRHGVAPDRIVVAGSGSEFIFRLTAAAARRGAARVALPRHAYGDYAAAAQAWGLAQVDRQDAHLLWTCEPSSPLGQADAALVSLASHPGTLVVDRAYEPLRLSGSPTRTPANAWELWTPNKALGLTGVRGAYAIAPTQDAMLAGTVQALAPSWVLGAHAVAMLQAWCDPQVQGWLEGSLPTLRQWKLRQQQACQSFGWRVLASDANYFTCEAAIDPEALRRHGVQLRGGASFGLPGHVRLGVLPPASQDALKAAMEVLS